MGVELELSQEHLARDPRAGSRATDAPFAASNERQAWFPRGAEVLPNPQGTAPGFCVPRRRRASSSRCPGRRARWLPMLEREVAAAPPSRRPARGDRSPSARFYLFGLSEGVFADRCGAWMDRAANPLLGVTAKLGVLSATLVATGADERERGRSRARARARVPRALRRVDLQRGRSPISRSRSAASSSREEDLRRDAESCTGGLVAARLTRVPGISAVFDRGYVTYSNRAEDGAPRRRCRRSSRATAPSRARSPRAMARGAAERSGARLAISLTGIAGPDGGTAEKPVGLVWFGVFARRRRRASRSAASPSAAAISIREFAANTAFDLLRRALPRD